MIRTFAIVAASLTLAGCQSGVSAELASQALGNLEHCKRTYQASIGGLGVPGGSLFIECDAKPRDPGP